MAAGPVLRPLQQRRLAERAVRWVDTIRRLNESGVRHMSASPPSLPEAEDSVHMLVLALQHLQSCVRLLTSAGVRIAGAREFRREERVVKPLRDLLEHEERYIVGRGRHPERVGQAWLEQGMFERYLLIWDDEGIQRVGFMGGTYFVRPAITAALELEAPLLAVRETSIE
jgi:hypothetical protein